MRCLVLVLVVMVLACGKSEPKGGPEPAADQDHSATLLLAIDALADEACACEDLTCVERVDKKFNTALRDANKLSKDDIEKVRESVSRAGFCTAKLSP